MLTGGSGMVGRNIQEHARAQAVELVAPRRSELDLSDAAAVDAYLGSLKPDLIIHAAGTVGGIGANMAAPVQFLTDNLTMGINLIMGARRAGVRRLLNIGSSCMYPRAGENPLREETVLTGALEPTNEGYALAKIACAKLCTYIAEEDPGFLYRTIIPCNLYGRHDKFDPLKAHMIPAVIAKIHSAVNTGASTVEIWGDGEARREFMYAGDLADFIFAAIDRFEDLPQDMNVGIGVDRSINDYYREIARILGYRGEFVHDLSKPSGMRRKLVDISRLKAFGWQARTGLEQGLRATLAFYEDGRGQ
ncbi:GDP-L-fucose synthase [Rhizobium sp. RU36D]|nr:GDP-L-fucose synthase [Rhizobium sp. RU36D]